MNRASDYRARGRCAVTQTSLPEKPSNRFLDTSSTFQRMQAPDLGLACSAVKLLTTPLACIPSSMSKTPLVQNAMLPPFPEPISLASNAA